MHGVCFANLPNYNTASGVYSDSAQHSLYPDINTCANTQLITAQSNYYTSGIFWMIPTRICSVVFGI